MAEALSVSEMSRDQCGLQDDESERRGRQCTARPHRASHLTFAGEFQGCTGTSSGSGDKVGKPAMARVAGGARA